MFIVISKIINRYGIVDTNDNVVEFLTVSEISELTNQGIEIAGIVNNTITVIPYKTDYTNLNYNNGKNIFNTATSLRKENATTYSFVSGKVRYKFKILGTCKAGVDIRLSKGVQTRIQDNFFSLLR